MDVPIYHVEHILAHQVGILGIVRLKQSFHGDH